MDLKAFNKLYAEAVEALAERRLTDAFALTDAILKDTQSNESLCILIDHLRGDYDGVLRDFATTEQDGDVVARLNELFQKLVSLLQHVRATWQQEKKVTMFGRLASPMTDLGATDLADQLRRTCLSSVGNKAYHEALDAAFGLAWCTHLEGEEDFMIVTRKMRKTDSFVRRVLAGGLLMGTLDRFSPIKIQLLVELGATAEADLQKASIIEDESQRQQLEDEAHDLLARVAVALVLIYQHNRYLMAYFPELLLLVKRFFQTDHVYSELPILLRSFVCQSLTDRVGKRMDDILPIIKEAVEKQQPHLGSSQDEEQDTSRATDDSVPAEEKKQPHLEVRVTKIDIKAGKKLFQRMANYAESIDAMRKNDMDVNFGNFSFMKRFDFFDHPAHWFYPFNPGEPTIQPGLHYLDGKPDTMTFSVMDHNRFCASDRYSYASMMAFLRRDGDTSLDQARQQIQEMQDEEGDDLFNTDDSASYRLNVFTDFCQTCYRFFHSTNVKEEYAYAFAPSDVIILPLLELFEQDFGDFSEVEDSIETYLLMGDSEHAILLLNHFTEHHGTTSTALEQRGRAFMQLRQWHKAVSNFQQSLLLEENEETQLYMARCYEALHEWDSALPLLLAEDRRRESKDPDLIEEVARCLIQLHRWDDAVQRFFQLELMGEHLSVCRRGIGWCSLHQGKYERAEQYYRTLVDNARHRSWEDCINLGHALWLQGKTSEALEAYRRFATTFNRSKKAQRQNFRHWQEAFREDALDLLASHFSSMQLALMQDAIAQK